MNKELGEFIADDFMDLLDLYQEIPNRPIYVLAATKTPSRLRLLTHDGK